MVKFALYFKLVLVILTLHRRGKLLEHFISIVVVLLLNILLSWAFVTRVSIARSCASRHGWFECYFRRSFLDSLPVTLVTAGSFIWLFWSTCYFNLLLYRFRGLPGFAPVSFLVTRRWNCLGMKRSSQPSSTLLRPGKRAEKTRQSVNRCEASNAKFRKNSILNRKR